MNFINLRRREKPAEKLAEAEGSDRAGGTGVKYRLDAIGQVCPFPLVEAKRAIEPLHSGDELQIDFDCTQATDSIPAWAADNGHAVTDFRKIDEATWTITVRKA